MDGAAGSRHRSRIPSRLRHQRLGRPEFHASRNPCYVEDRRRRDRQYFQRCRSRWSLGQVSIYTASKHAVEGLTKALALEFAKQNIRINAVAPGAIATEMFDRFAGKRNAVQVASIIPVGRVGASEEIAAAVLYLSSDDAKFTTGTSLVVDGGFIAQ